MRSVNIDEWNGKFVFSDFNPNYTTINTIKDFDFKALNIDIRFILYFGNKTYPYYPYNELNYVGMMNENKKPHGFRRAFDDENYFFLDGQFTDG